MFELNPLSNDEPIRLKTKKIGKLGDFWEWSYSALYTPITRGFFAEYIVFKSVFDNADKNFRPPINYLSTKMEKDEPDIITFFDDKKMTIQVKSIDSLTKGHRFKLNKTQTYNPKLDKNDGQKKHNCDLFVLCFLNLDNNLHIRIDNLRKSWNKSNFISKPETEIIEYKKTQDTLNRSVLEITNWVFYICSADLLEKQNSVDIKKLDTFVKNIKIIKCGYPALAQHLMTLNKLKVN
jgi:hypothetical protein